LPQKTPVINILSSKPRFQARNASLSSPERLQIDKMPEKEIFAGVCGNEKKAVTLSQSKIRPETNLIHFIYNF
jgi:hypothetical protein